MLQTIIESILRALSSREPQIAVPDPGGGVLAAPPSLHDRLKRMFLEYGHPWEYPIIFGIRDNANWREDKCNDLHGIVLRPQNHWPSPEIYVWWGTTDTGTHNMDPARRKRRGWPAGAAHLLLGHHAGCWAIGEYKGHPALRDCSKKPRTKPMRIFRDVDGDFEHGPDDLVTTARDIFMHWNYRELKGTSSAGCQEPETNQHLVDAIRLLEQTGCKRFSYTLFSREQVPAALYADLKKLANEARKRGSL